MMLVSYPTITLWQPWATLVAAGAKPFEFRAWPAPQRLWGRRVAGHTGTMPGKAPRPADAPSGAALFAWQLVRAALVACVFWFVLAEFG